MAVITSLIGWRFTNVATARDMCAKPVPYDELLHISKLEDMSDEERKQLLAAMSDHRRDVQSALMTMLDSPNRSVKCHAAFLLGWGRFSGAVKRLSEILTLRDTARRTSALWWWGEYPVVDALTDIGNPALPAMIKKLETTDDAETRKLALFVIDNINEHDSDLSKFMLQRAIARQAEKAKRARLLKAINALTMMAQEKKAA